METEYAISLYETSFTLADVETITGVSKKNIRNWLDRNVIELYMDRLTTGGGRRLFAPIDIMKIAVLGELTQQTQMQPSSAWEATQLVEKRAMEIMDKNVREIYQTDISKGYRDPQYAILRIVKGQLFVGHINQSQFPKTDWTRACVLLPLDRVVFDTFKELIELRREEVNKFRETTPKKLKVRFADLTLKKDALINKIDSESREPTQDEEYELLMMINEIERLRKALEV